MLSDNEETEFFEIASRYLVGEGSSADRDRLVEMLHDPDARAMFEEMRLGWECDPTNLEKGFDGDRVKRLMEDAIHNEPKSEPEPKPEVKPESGPAPVPEPPAPRLLPDPATPVTRAKYPGRWLSWPVVGALAASIVILGIAAVIWFRPNRSRTVATQPPVTWTQQTCGVGERLLITLSDGTKITLNSGSTLSHPETFGPHNRVVRLTGEAFFDVTHDEARPFVIDTPTLRIRVVGTQFNVRAFDDGSKAQVSVVQGKVQVSELAPVSHGTAQPVSLTPGQQYDFAPETRVAKVQSVPPETATGWMQDAFVWKHEPAASAMRQLERRFGFSVEFSDPKLATDELNGNFAGNSVEEIFETLRKTQVFNYRIVRNHDKIERVILSPGRLADQTL